MSKIAKDLYICGKQMSKQAASYSNPKKKFLAKHMEVIFYKKAMSLGYIKPAYELYERFKDGDGVGQNNDLALIMFSIAWKFGDKRCDPGVTLSSSLLKKAEVIIKFIREANQKSFEESNVATQEELFNTLAISDSIKLGDCFRVSCTEPIECKGEGGVGLAGVDAVQSQACVIL